MLQGFVMEISEADMLRVINAGIKSLASTPITAFIEEGDRVTSIRYSTTTKLHTLIFRSGRELKVVRQPLQTTRASL